MTTEKIKAIVIGGEKVTEYIKKTYKARIPEEDLKTIDAVINFTLEQATVLFYVEKYNEYFRTTLPKDGDVKIEVFALKEGKE